MRVVHVCCTDSFAGVERHVADLATAQAVTGHEVTVVGGNPQRMQGAVGPGVLVRSGSTAAESSRRLRETPVPDIVHVHMTAAEVAVALTVRLRNVPVVATRHFAAPRGARAWTRPVTRLAARRIDAEIAVSRFVAAQVDGRSTVIHAGVPDQPDRLPSAQRRRTVLLAQRLEPEKKTGLALEAFAESGICGRGWRLDVAGDGSLREELEAQARELGIASSTSFLGSRHDVDRLMRTCGVFLAPRGDEAYGLSVLEAMAAGAPVVAAAGGGHLETAGNVSGAALFTVDDADDAARKLAALVDDQTMRDNYGSALQQCQRTRFTLDRQVAETDAVYRSLV